MKLHFAYRARAGKERNHICLAADDLSLFCDRDWLNEAIDNIVKNAFDHTGKWCIQFVLRGTAVAVWCPNCDNG